MSFAYPIMHYPAMLTKDVAFRFAQAAHALVHRRGMYPVLMHNNVRCYRCVQPIVEDAAFVAPNANIQGNVIMGPESSAMYHVSMRNYHQTIPTRIGDGTSLLENVSVIGQVTVGSNCVVGIGSTLDCCAIHENVILGHHCHVALGVTIEQGSIIASGSTVAKDTRVPANELWAGNPAEKICDVTEEHRAQANALIRNHIQSAKNHNVAITQHYGEMKTYNLEWLHEMCAKMEQHHQSVAFEEDIKIPIEGRRFLKPRVHAVLPHIHPRVSYPVNRIAPHKPRLADWTGNS